VPWHQVFQGAQGGAGVVNVKGVAHAQEKLPSFVDGHVHIS